MDRFAAISSFIAAVELGSFSAAADHTGQSQPTVSAHIKALETELGARLFNRTTRRLVLTEAGDQYYSMVHGLIRQVDEATRAVRNIDEQMTGGLNIGVSVGFAEQALAEFILQFKTRYPNILLKVSMTEEFVDLFSNGLDVAVRMGRIEDENLVIRRLGAAPRRLAASPGYLDKMGRPKHPSELADHQYLLYANFPEQRQLTLTNRQGEQATVGLNPSMIVNNSSLIRQAAIAGLGIGVAQTWLLKTHVENGALEYVLPDWRYDAQPVQAVYPSNRFIPLKVKRFVAELASYFEQKNAFE